MWRQRHNCVSMEAGTEKLEQLPKNSWNNQKVKDARKDPRLGPSRGKHDPVNTLILDI